jgi:hypothetical protein
MITTVKLTSLDINMELVGDAIMGPVCMMENASRVWSVGMAGPFTWEVTITKVSTRKVSGMERAKW